MSTAKRITAEQLAALFKPGQRVFMPGSSGAPMAVARALECGVIQSMGLEIYSSFVPGINAFDLTPLAPDCRVSGLFMQPAWADAQREGRYRQLPSSYAGFVRELNERLDFDWLVVQVSPPDAQGRCSLGPAVEFVPSVLGRCRQVLAVINQQTPPLKYTPSIPMDRFSAVLEVDEPLATYVTALDDDSIRIANYVAEHIQDGDTLQIGLGRVPSALCHALTSRKNLRMHSGMVSDGFMQLHNAGALDMRYAHSACVLLGSQALYDQAPTLSGLNLKGCEYTHDPRTLRDLKNLVAVNSALEVDLFGQCNLEHANGRAVSGAGGAPDFARGARLSQGGKSIVALNASIGTTGRSRIVASLSPPALASLSRVDIDYLVTEYGVATLIGASVHERAHAIIEVADPLHRPALHEAWRSIAARL